MAGVSGSEPADAWVPACDSGKPASPSRAIPQYPPLRRWSVMSDSRIDVVPARTRIVAMYISS